MRRRARVLLVIAVSVGLLASLAWLARPTTPARPASLQPVLPAASEPPEAVSSADALPASAPLSAEAANRARRDELWCKLISQREPERSAVEDDAPQLPRERPEGKLMAEAREDLVQRWSAQLQAQGDERSRALALRLRALGKEPLPVDSEARHQLIALAQTTSLPEVYAWAHQSCSGDASCEAQLPARQFLRLDPGNRYALDLVFSEAARDGDLQAQREVLYQAGIAPGSNDYGAEAIRMLGALPLKDDGPEPAAASMLYVQIGLMNMPNFAPVTRYCKAEGPDQADRRALCVQAAQTRGRQAKTLLDLGLSRGLARVSGDEALAASLTRDYDALMKAHQDASSQMLEIWASDGTCAAGAIMLKQMYTVMTQGELAWARARLAAASAAAR